MDDEFLKRLRGRAQSWLDGATDATDAVPHDKFDELTHEDVRGQAPDYDGQIDEYVKEYDYVEALFADLFYLLHKGDPQVRERGEMAASHVPNREIIEAFSKLQEVKDLRDFTRGDPLATAMGIGSMDTEIGEALARMKAAQELADQLQKLREQIQQAAEQALKEMDPDTLAELIAQGMDAEQEAGGVQVELDAATEEALAEAMASLKGGAGRAADEAQESADLASSFGVQDGEVQRMSFAERRALAMRLRGSRMAQYAQLFGSLKMLSIAARRRRVDHVPSEVAGLEFTDDLARLAPQEYLNLASTELESDFWLRYANHQLMTWRVHGTERQGKGPIIAVCDESGSMSSPDLGGATREAWSKAFVLALADVARREKRGMYYIGFSSRNQVYEVDLGSGGLDAVMSVCEHFFSGGTHYEKPLGLALERALERYSQDKTDRPDVVFITDDEYTHIHPEFLQAWNEGKQKLSMACHGVAIGTQGSGSMPQVCDHVALLSDLVTGNNLAADIFKAL